MAGKEAVIIILDVSPSMGQILPGGKSNLDLSLECISMLIQRKIFLEPKDEVALILFGTDETHNNLADQIEEMGAEDQYQNIVTLRGLTFSDWNLVEELQGIRTHSQHADFIDAVIVGLDILRNDTQNKKFSSFKVLAFSDLEGHISDDELNIVTKKINNFGIPIDFKLVCPFPVTEDSRENNLDSQESRGDDHSSGKPKSENQMANIKIMDQFLNSVDGSESVLKDILPGMKYYSSIKPVRANPWNVNLTIGEDLKIPVSGFKKISQTTTSTWLKTSVEDDNIKLASETIYHLNDEAQTEIERDDTISGYCYGSTMVPFLDVDKINMAYEVGSKCLSVLGFTKQSNIKRHHLVGDKVDFILARKDDDAAAVALSAIIHGLFETEMIAIARYAYSARSNPRLVLLAPRIKSQFECLVSIQLPFMEDLRQFTFAPLNTYKKNIPSNKQNSVIERMIDGMSLINNENADIEYNPHEVVDPYLQRYYQCLNHRVEHADGVLPEVPSHLNELIQPSSTLMTSCEDLLRDVKEIFKLEKVSTKRKDVGGDSYFDINSKEDPDSKRPKLDDDLKEGMSGIIGVIESPIKEANSETKEITENIENEPDEADDLFDMM